MPIDIPEEKQKFKINLNTPEDLIPEYVRNFVVSNIVNRVLSYLYGWDYDQEKPVKLKALGDGSLVVSISGAAYVNNITKSGTVYDSAVVEEFEHVVTRVDVWNGSEELIIARDSGDGVWQDEIKISPNQFYSFDAVTKKLKLVSTSSGTTYQIVGWW